MGAPLRQWKGCSSGAGSNWYDLCLNSLFGVPNVGRLLRSVWQQLHYSAPPATGFALGGADEKGCGGA